MTESATTLTLSDLAPRPIWVAWQTEDRKDGKPTKVPYAPDGRKARADAPSTWGKRPEAELRAALLPKPYKLGGVGLELSPLGDGTSLGGIDLDSCRDTESGKLEGWAEDVLGKFDSYAEVSPSETGVKIFCVYDTDALASLRTVMGGSQYGKQFKQGGGDHPRAIEVHLGNRYFTVTDALVPGNRPNLRHVESTTIERLVKFDGPAFAAAGKTERRQEDAGNDHSRSAIALRKGMALVRAGCDFSAMVAGLEVDPETREWTREKGYANGGRELKRIFEKVQASLKVDGFDLTEDGIALAFAKRHADDLRYCHSTGAWFRYDAIRWRQDQTKLAFSWARQTCRMLATSATESRKVTLARAATAAAVEKFAQSDPALAVTAAIWDQDAFLLGTPAGTVDLRTGELRAPVPEDHISKLTAVAPAATPDCPLWLDFLDQATGADAGLIRFLRQWCGYCLTGDIREHALIFLYGGGGNGKGVYLHTTAGIMGDYARNAPMDTFTACSNDKHPTELAMLRGARLVTASETEEGRVWAEARIKQMTGGDVITARFMRENFFEYIPQFKLTIIGNHKPVLRNVDDAAERRFNMVPFLFKPEREDKELENKLRAEWPAILRWMIEGCLDWQMNGLVRPKVLLDATAEYFADQDIVSHWLQECCNLGPHKSETMAVLFKSWSDFAIANGEKPNTTKWFSQTVARQPGCEMVKNTPGFHGKRGFKGIEVKPVPQKRWEETKEPPPPDDYT